MRATGRRQTRRMARTCREPWPPCARIGRHAAHGAGGCAAAGRLRVAARRTHRPAGVDVPAAWNASLRRSATPTALASWWQRFGDPTLTALVEQALPPTPTSPRPGPPAPGARAGAGAAGAASAPAWMRRPRAAQPVRRAGSPATCSAPASTPVGSPTSSAASAPRANAAALDGRPAPPASATCR